MTADLLDRIAAADRILALAGPKATRGALRRVVAPMHSDARSRLLELLFPAGTTITVDEMYDFLAESWPYPEDW